MSEPSISEINQPSESPNIWQCDHCGQDFLWDGKSGLWGDFLYCEACDRELMDGYLKYQDEHTDGN